MLKCVVVSSLIVLTLHGPAFAQGPLSKRTVALRMALPDGTSSTVRPEDPLPPIEDGTIIEALPSPMNDIASVDITVRGHTVHLTPGKIIQATAGTNDGGIRVLQGRVTVTGPTGRVKILRPAQNDKDAVEYVPPSIPDPHAAEQKIKADEALPDISPIHA